MAGYDWSSGKSNNAVEAEENGKLPLSRAVKSVSRRAGITQAAARQFIKWLGCCEYHHTSKFYNSTDYYDADAAVRLIEMAKKLELPLNESFAGSCLASGLQEENNPFDVLSNPPDEYSTTIQEFIDDVNSDEWTILLKRHFIRKVPAWFLMELKKRFPGNEYSFDCYTYKCRTDKVYAAEVFKNGVFIDNSVQLTAGGGSYV